MIIIIITARPLDNGDGDDDDVVITDMSRIAGGSVTVLDASSAAVTTESRRCDA